MTHHGSTNIVRRKINILILVDEFYSSAGGTEQHVFFLLEKLSRELYQVYFAVLSRIHHQEMSTFPVRPVMLRSDGDSIRMALHNLIALIRENAIDVVHAFSLTSEYLASIAVRVARMGRVLGARRNSGYWHTGKTLWQARLLRPFGITYAANCEAAKQFAVEHEWVPDAKISVIHNPVHSAKHDQGRRNIVPRESFGAAIDERVVGIVATVRPVKDHPTFFRAAALVLREHPKTRFLVVGGYEAEIQSDLMELVEELGIERHVKWIGTVENVFTLLPHFDVGVLASHSEGFSNALLEYAVAGVAAVATDVGGTREVIRDGHTGFVVPAGDYQQMAVRISHLLGNNQLRIQFGENAKQWVLENFSEDHVLTQYGELYARLSNL